MGLREKRQEKILNYLKDTSDAINKLQQLTDEISSAAQIILDAFRENGKLLIFGNGGSAADAQHIATEMVCRFRINRKSLPAIALTTNTSLITAIANDYNFDDIFSRQIEAIAAKDDVILAISTSGNSPNVIKAAQTAKNKNLKIIVLTGSNGGRLKEFADILINIPIDATSYIQECHITVGHILCNLVEEELF